MRFAECKPRGQTTAERACQPKGEFRKVGENLYRYSSNDRYYGVFRVNGKLIWKSLKTSDRDLAKRKLKEEKEKQGRVDPEATKLTLSELLDLYKKSLEQFDDKIEATCTSILSIFKRTWEQSLDVPVQNISAAQLELWLAKHKARMKKVSFNEYMRARLGRHARNLHVWFQNHRQRTNESNTRTDSRHVPAPGLGAPDSSTQSQLWRDDVVAHGLIGTLESLAQAQHKISTAHRIGQVKQISDKSSHI